MEFPASSTYMDGFEHDIAYLYRRYFPLILAKCRRILGAGEAEDVTQDTFIKLWRQHRKIGLDPRAVTAWMYRTATRGAVDRLRARSREHRLPLEEAMLIGPEEVVATRQVLARLARELDGIELDVAILPGTECRTVDQRWVHPRRGWRRGRR